MQMELEIKDPMHGYPSISSPKLSDIHCLSEYDAYIGHITTNNDLACNGSCACGSRLSSSSSSPYNTMAPAPAPAAAIAPSATAPSASPLSSHSSISHHAGILSPPPVVLYPHPYPSHSPLIIHNVPHVSETHRVAAKYPDIVYNPQAVTPPRDYHPAHYHYPPRYYSSHVVANTASVNYYAAPVTSAPAAAPVAAHHHIANISVHTPPPRSRARATGARTPPNARIEGKKAAKARYYGYIAPTTATKTMNNRRQQMGERRQMRQWTPNVLVANEIVCSFHMDFIPKLGDLRKYLSDFGEVASKIAIEWDCIYGGGPNIDGPIKGVPLATIRFKSEAAAQRVCDRSCTHVIPSGIKFRAYRSMQHYVDSYNQKLKKKKKRINADSNRKHVHSK